MNKNLKTVGYAFQTKEITKLSKDLEANGYMVKLDKSAGTLVASLNGEEMVRALQLGRGRTWLVRADPRAISWSPVNV